RTDLLTNDPTIAGTANDDIGVSKLEVKIDNGSFQDITSSLTTGKYQFTPANIAPGPHHVVVQATDTSSQTGQATLDFTMNHPPIANAGGNKIIHTFGTVAFDGSGSSDADGPLFAYHWTFDDGSTADGPTVSHLYAHSGVFPVQLAVTDTAGSVVTDS